MTINEIACHILQLKWGQKILKFKREHPEHIALLISHTNFMPASTSIFVRATLTNRCIYEVPNCICGAKVCWNKKHKEFNKHCSTKCRTNDPTFQAKTKEGLLRKYGVANISNIPGVSEAKQKTCLANNGVSWPQQSPKIREKTKTTNNNTFGCDYPMQSHEIREKTQKTNMKLYGVQHPITSDKIRNKIKSDNLSKYGVEHSLQRLDVRDKIKQTMISTHGCEYPMMRDNIKQTRIDNNNIKYGVDYPSQQHLPLEKLDNHDWLFHHHITNQMSLVDLALELQVDWSTVHKYLIKQNIQPNTFPEQQNIKRKNTFRENFNRKHHTQQHISPLSLQLLENYDWLFDQHITKQQPLYVIGQALGCSDGTVGRYLHAHDIKTCIYNSSVGEQEVADFVSSLDIKTITNTRSVINPLELDIFIPSHNLAIEYCGLYWHSEQQGKNKHYHQNKYNRCKKIGIRLLTIFEDEWLLNKQLIQNKISNILQKSKTANVFARKTRIVQVTKNNKQSFLNDNHIQGTGLSSINIGLEHDGMLVACMSFSKHKNYHLLTRYATSCSVVGGFSKLLQHFKHNYDWTQLVSFADLRWSEGDVYFKTGWLVDKIIPPDYSYATSNTNRYHKFNYRRKHLPHKLKNFDPNLSERENCDNNGILRIWDCGKLRFVIKNS